ncbi:hypothetical protein [Polyangium sorediatum]|uniref:Uncharacterized protein n=1 Tax=Polyangium sorediatum TaxID=889274 RepID=A0ABT6NP53_9BACT|nr:hypothetical protein [Polyangium sorediatum]MDI1430103.1 hypothetical protein [Polyangium sorediatum]
MDTDALLQTLVDVQAKGRLDGLVKNLDKASADYEKKGPGNNLEQIKITGFDKGRLTFAIIAVAEKAKPPLERRLESHMDALLAMPADDARKILGWLGDTGLRVRYELSQPAVVADEVFPLLDAMEMDAMLVQIQRLQGLGLLGPLVQQASAPAAGPGKGPTDRVKLGLDAGATAIRPSPDDFESRWSKELQVLSGLDRAVLKAFRLRTPVILEPVRGDEASLKGNTFEIRKQPDFESMSIYVPPAAEASEENHVHLFFTANNAVGSIGNDILVHGLRGAAQDSKWIVIGLGSPGDKPVVPDFRTISTAEIEGALQTIGRKPGIKSLRLTAHSRGHRGLERTLTGNVDPKQRIKGGPVPGPLIDLGIVDRVTVLDAFFNDTQFAIETKVPKVPGNASTAERGISADKLVVYHVTDGVNVKPGDLKAGAQVKNLLPQSCLAALGCIRLIQDALVNRPGFQAIVNDPANKDIKKELDKLPASMPRGTFSSMDPAPKGKESLNAFCEAKTFAVQRLLKFVNDNDLATFEPFRFNQFIAAHHFFVTEIAHELFE